MDGRPDPLAGALPRVSIVIPTAGRPTLLPRAVASALEGMSPGEVEVIVVPNGPDDSWRVSLASFIGNPDVRVLPIATAHACAARNHGMQHARGEYLRFLDDDDRLYGDGCRAQLALARHAGADVCSSPVCLLDEAGHVFDTAWQPGTPDFVHAALCRQRMLQCTAHLFRRKAVADIAWNEQMPYSQDIEWVLRLCAVRDFRWVKGTVPCGAWSRHTGDRISTGAPLSDRKRIVAEAILAIIPVLERAGRLTAHRRAGAASGLWDGVRTSLAFAPLYWSGVARAADAIDPGSRPGGAVHRSVLAALGWPPLLIEACLLPKRLAEYGWRRLALALRLGRYW